MEQSNSWLESASIPSVAMLDRVIDLKFGAPVDDWLAETLLTPVSDIMGGLRSDFAPGSYIWVAC